MQLAGLIRRIADGTISNNIAKKVFEALWTGEGATADAIIDKQGPEADHRHRRDRSHGRRSAGGQRGQVVEEFRAGKEKAFNALVGQVMKAAKGKANPQQVNDLLRRKLAG